MSLLDIAQARKGKARDSVGKAKAGVSQAGTRVEYGTATAASADGYVEIIMDNGGSAFTVPCDSVINQGDRVSYISHGGQGKAVSLYSTTAAIEANAALAQQAYDNADDAAQAASDAAQAASDASDEAQAAMDAIDQHFWSDTDGVHVTSVTQDDWADSSSSDYHSGKNILINTLGVIFRNALAYLAQFTASGVTFFDGSGTSADHQTAQFTSTTARVGMLSQKHVTMNSTGVNIADGNYTQAMFNGGSVAFYDGTGNAASNIVAQFGKNGAQIGSATSSKMQVTDSALNFQNAQGVNIAAMELSGTTVSEPVILSGTVTASFNENANVATATRAVTFSATPQASSTVSVLIVFYRRGNDGVTNYIIATPSGGTKTYTYGSTTVISGNLSSTTSAIVGTYSIAPAAGKVTLSVSVDRSSTTNDPGYIDYTIRYQASAYDAPAFTFGTRGSSTLGAYSNVLGRSLRASYACTTALGMYNANMDRPLVIGTGSSDADRASGFSVTWSGSPICKSPNIDIDSSTLPSSQTWGNARLYFQDADNTTIAQVAPVRNTDGHYGMVLGPAGNYLYLRSDGTTANADVGFSSRTPWLTALHIGSVTWVRTANLSLTAGADTKVTLNGSSTATPPGYINTNSSLLGYTSGGIQCKVAGYVKVSAAVFAENLTAGNGGLAIWVQNGTTVLRELSVPIPSVQGFGTAVFPEYTVQVAANDVLYLYARSTYAGRIAANKAWMTVQYVG